MYSNFQNKNFVYDDEKNNFYINTCSKFSKLMFPQKKYKYCFPTLTEKILLCDETYVRLYEFQLG